MSEMFVYTITRIVEPETNGGVTSVTLPEGEFAVRSTPFLLHYYGIDIPENPQVGDRVRSIDLIEGPGVITFRVGDRLVFLEREEEENA